MVVALTAEVSNANVFTLTGNQHLDVVTEYTLGGLYDFSTADVRQGGFVSSISIHNNAVLRVLEYRYGTYGLSIGRTSIFGNGQVIVSGGQTAAIAASENGGVTISGGETGSILALGNSHIVASGGIVPDFRVNDSSSLIIYGENFILGEGLWFNGDQLFGTGILSGQWFDGTSWTTQITDNDETATILLIPEPATLMLLGLGGFWLVKRKR